MRPLERRIQEHYQVSIEDVRPQVRITVTDDGTVKFERVEEEEYEEVF